MTARAGPIESVVVVGGGIVGWSAAAALKKRVRTLDVGIVASPPSPNALAERAGSTLPSIVGFHADLGLTELDAVARTGSGYRLGSLFEGWSNGRPGYVHSYAGHGAAIDGAPFHLHWARVAREGRSEPYDSYSAAAAMARNDRFVHPASDAGARVDEFEYGLQLNGPKYLQMMRAFATHLGVRTLGDRAVEVGIDPQDGFVDFIRLPDGAQARADLYVDCTGPAATIRSALGDGFQDWSGVLLCDRVLAVDSRPPSDPPVLDKVSAMSAGWRWEAASPARRSQGMVYSSRHMSDEDAGRPFGAHSQVQAVPIRQGRWNAPWLRNCVAVGDAAAAVEPLEWSNLHLVHSALDRIVSMLPDKEFAPVELAEYNRQAEVEADRVRDFILLHYVTADRPGEPFWADASAIALPETLQHTLRLFRERGRLPFHEEETFSRDSWLAVLFGQGVLPRRVDPLTDSLPLPAAAAQMSRMRAAVASTTASLPFHSAALRSLAVRAPQ